jgi:hypothetical protein
VGAGLGGPARPVSAVTGARQEGRRRRSAHQNNREVFSVTFSQETGSNRSFWCALLRRGGLSSQGRRPDPNLRVNCSWPRTEKVQAVYPRIFSAMSPHGCN